MGLVHDVLDRRLLTRSATEITGPLGSAPATDLRASSRVGAPQIGFQRAEAVERDRELCTHDEAPL
jgi:hypothetical protein